MRSTLRMTAVLALAVTIGLVGCNSGDSTEGSTASSEATSAAAEETSEESSEPAEPEGEWPRTIEHEAGSTEIPQQPMVIVSTSISLTGTLLAIDAPLTATAATSVSGLTDDKGFFSQWASVADERGVSVLYPNLELDLEAIEAAAPDLIIGSSVGGDSTLEAYDQLSEIAPTVLLDYGGAPWQDLAEVIGEATGLETNAAEVVAGFDDSLTAAAAELTPPADPVAVMTYQGADGVAVFNPASPQVSILTALGFSYIEVAEELASQVRSDASFFTAENSAAALENAQTLMPIPVGGDPSEALTADPLLANQPAIVNDQVVLLPVSAFRLDYYSSTELVDFLLATYGG